MNTDDLIFYDIEVYRYDSLVVCKDINNCIIGYWWNNPPGEFPEDSPNGFEGIRPWIGDRILVGYNNHHYDDPVLTCMMAGEPQQRIKALNDAIIANADIPIYKKRASTLLTLDTMQQISVEVPSLKQIEGNLGKSVFETPIPFDLDRPLTEQEKQTVFQYCSYDVENTIEVFKRRQKGYFEVKEQLVKLLPETSRLRNPLKLNTTTLAASILLSKPLPKWADLRRLPDYVRNTPDIPAEVWEMWESVTRLSDKEQDRKTYKVKMYGCDIVFAFGGLHGVASQGTRFDRVKLLDVGSMYPSIILALDALGTGIPTYRRIRDDRLKLKKTDPLLANAYKLILNSVYGLLKNQYSILYNPMASTSVCVYGQCALFNLAKRLYEKGYTLVNLNTDGVAFVDDKGIGDEPWKEVQKEWESVYQLSLDLDEFKRWIQRDVNNYVALASDDHIKVKGGDVRRYHDPDTFGNDNARIIQIAIVENLLNGVPVYRTVMAHLDEPTLYQYILKAGKTYAGVTDTEGREYNNCNRVFAAKKSAETTRLYKKRQDGGLVNFPDMPENMLVWNGEVKDLTGFRDIVDIKHYCDVAEKKLEAWR